MLMNEPDPNQPTDATLFFDPRFSPERTLADRLISEANLRPHATTKDQINRCLYSGIRLAQDDLETLKSANSLESAFSADAVALVQRDLFQDILEDPIAFRQNSDGWWAAVTKPKRIEAELDDLQQRTIDKLENVPTGGDILDTSAGSVIRVNAEAVAYYHAEIQRISPCPFGTGEVSRILMGHQLRCLIYPRNLVAPLFPGLRWSALGEEGGGMDAPAIPYLESLRQALHGADDDKRLESLTNLLIECCERSVLMIHLAPDHQYFSELDHQRNQLQQGLF